jgi:RNA polymerase sigma factor (sigma-70 family)
MQPQETSWTLIRDAASGQDSARDRFVRRYQPAVVAYLRTRWTPSSLSEEIEDATQDVFVACFREGGVLERADAGRSGGFRAFFFGVIQRTAQQFETQRARKLNREANDTFYPDEVMSDEETLSRVFDKAWARTIIQEAGELQLERARVAGAEQQLRVELLRLRFQDGLPIRKIAERWGRDTAGVHRDYARARQEFHAALREVVQRQEGCAGEALERACGRLLALLQD